MNKPRAHILRIAETPDLSDMPDMRDTPAASDSGVSELESDSSKGKRRKRRGLTQKLSPEEMDVELDRVNRLNGIGGPTIFRGDEDELQGLD